MQERIEYEEGGLPVRIARSWSFDRFRKLYRIAQTDNFSFMMNVLEGSAGEGKLTLDNGRSGTSASAEPGAEINRLVVHDPGPGGFAAEWESSRDEGNTWNTEVKYTYTRK